MRFLKPKITQTLFLKPKITHWVFWVILKIVKKQFQIPTLFTKLAQTKFKLCHCFKNQF